MRNTRSTRCKSLPGLKILRSKWDPLVFAKLSTSYAQEAQFLGVFGHGQYTYAGSSSGLLLGWPITTVATPA